MLEKAVRSNANLLGMYCRDITRYSLLTRDEEKDLFRRFQSSGNPALKERLILANLRFVIQEAKKFSRGDIQLMDLVAEGTIGLIKAIERFDPRKNVHFISYAVWWIRQSIFEYLNRTHSLIYIPANLLKKIRSEEKWDRLKSDPRSRSRLSVIRNSFLNILRFHDRFGENGEDEYLNVIPAEARFGPDAMFQKEQFNQKVNGLLNRLSLREKKVVEMRFGLGTYRRMSLKEISASFRLTKERIRQIQNKALAKLKKIYKSQHLKDYLGES
jgi:RNA polymerase primary sigma factor